MPADVATRTDINLDAFLYRVLAVNPFLDNRVNGPSPQDADVAGIHQAAFERLTTLAGEALQTQRGIGAMLWGEAGIGKSHLLSRLARWSEESRATFVYLHNLQAAPDLLPRSLLRAVVALLTRGRAYSFHGTPLSGLVYAGVLEAVNQDTGWHSWEHLHRAWNLFIDRLAVGGHPGLAGVDRRLYEVLFSFYYSSFRASLRREDGRVARLAMRYLSGLALEPDEGRALSLPPSVPRDEPVALADNQQIKQVLVALTRLAAARHQPFILAFDQVDNLDTDQASAMSRFLEALIDAAPNLLVVTTGVRATLFQWRQAGVIQHSSWDRLAQFEIELQRVTSAEAGQMIRARLDDFFASYADLAALRHRREQDAYFPLGHAWFERQFKDKSDLRPRDVINQAREAWRAEQERLRTVGMPDWLTNGPVALPPLPPTSSPDPETLDRLLDDKIAQLCSPSGTQPSPSGDADDLSELMRAVLEQCRDADPDYGVVEVKRVPAVKKGHKPLYDLSILLHDRPDTPSVRVGLLVLTTTRAGEVAVRLRRLTNNLPAVDRFVLLTVEWIGLPVKDRGTIYLTTVQEHFGERFQHLELTWAEHQQLNALCQTVQDARGGDLEIDTGEGATRHVAPKEVIASHRRKGRYLNSRVLRKLLGQSAAAATRVDTLDDETAEVLLSSEPA